MKTPLFAITEDALILGSLLKLNYDVHYFPSLENIIENRSLAPRIIFLDIPEISDNEFEKLRTSLNNIPQFVIRGGKITPGERTGVKILSAKSECDEVIHEVQNIEHANTVRIYHPKKVLIIEDNKSINEMYSIAFANEGCEVSSAYDGLDGITKAASVKPDIIILDIMMPNMDGFEMLKILKSNTSLEAKVIVNSNLEWVDEENRARALGADGFLRKSKYTPLDVVSKILWGQFNG